MFEKALCPPAPEQWGFVGDLEKASPPLLTRNCDVLPRGAMRFPRRLTPILNFPDPEQLLDSAVTDLTRLLAVNGLYQEEGGWEIRLEATATSTFEEYFIRITPEYCVISAADSEGIRRGIYELEDLICAGDGAGLPIQEIHRLPWLKSRISRCFFSPVKRHPVNTDELLDEINYYPDEYLNRLAHEGINGVWLVASFRELAQTDFTPLDAQAEKRLDKLEKTVRQCARFGIKVFIFCIEPFGVLAHDPLLREHPEMFGASCWGGKTAFCPSTEETARFLRQCTRFIFSRVKRLGGIINITHGERPSSCLSALSGLEDIPVPCPRCGQVPQSEVVRRVLQPMRDGMDEAGAGEALLISWFYLPYAACYADWVHTIAERIPAGVITQFNFESGGARTQNGRKHYAGDYWLAYAGPSARFKQQVECANANAVVPAAKLQVGCGHEMGTVPLIPAPGLLYRKFMAMKKLHVSHAMFCWYLGNYPGVMNLTAGRLAFADFSEREEEFLARVLRPCWGEFTPMAVKAFGHFKSAYTRLPFSLIFQYYGPQNAGASFALSFLPELKPLTPPWKPNFPFSGDAIGEALCEFSIEEVIDTLEKMLGRWRQGVAVMEKIRARAPYVAERQGDFFLAEAIMLMLENSWRIFRFYQLRRELFCLESAPALEEMAEIVRQEMAFCDRMAALCEADPRLGFHSEALTYCFHPAQLRWRKQELQQLLDCQYRLLRDALQEKRHLYEYFCQSVAPDKVVHAKTSYRCECVEWQYHLQNRRFELEMTLPLPVSDTGEWGIAFYFVDRYGVSFPVTVHTSWRGTRLLSASRDYCLIAGFECRVGLPVHMEFCDGKLHAAWDIGALPGDGAFRFNFQYHNEEGVFFGTPPSCEYRLLLGPFTPDTGMIIS